MLPSISRNPILESSLKNSSVDLKSRTLKQHLFTPTEFQVPHFHQHQNQNLSHSQHQTIHQPALIQQKRLTATEKREEKTLDGFSLLENVGMALPDDAIFGVLCDKKYTTVVESDFVFFVQLMYLDVSENYLQLSHFGNLPRLQELRLACNEIRDIQRDDLVNFSLGDRFLSLQNLDLSYNSLTVTSIHSLGCLPYLRELNLCGNQLSELPDMSTFYCLEKLLLENNKFERAQVFHNLSVIPNLREVSLAYNYLSEIPKSSCRLGKFKVLETLDVAFNYFGSDTSVDGILDLVRLRTLFLYGNPVLGPTGEDPHFIYVEDLALAAIESRGGGGEAYRSSYPIEVSEGTPSIS